MTRGVVITGVGAVTPLGDGARTLHERWAAGEVGIEDGVAPCSDFDPAQRLSAKEARRSDRFTQLARSAAQEALEQAAWDESEPPYDPDRVGCVLGTGIGGIETIEDSLDVLRDKGPERVSPLAVPLLMSNAAPAALAMRHGLQGEAYSVVSACAAGAQALGAATRAIRHGEADAVVSGGSEAGLTKLARAAFSNMDAISPTGTCRPFDRRRDGFVMGEGAAILVLEDAERAQERGAEPLAEVLGYGASADAHHLTAPEPEGRGASRAIARALQDAEIEPADVDYVNAHGTSTPLNDRAETLALKASLGERARQVPVSSTKSAIGHTLGAAGAIEAVATILALRERVAPPTLGHEEPDDDLDLDYVPERARPLEPSDGRLVGLSNSFGFGGHNAVLALGVQS